MDGPPAPDVAGQPGAHRAVTAPDDAASPSSPRPSWQWFAVAIATVLIVAAIVVAATRLGGDDDETDAQDPVATSAGNASADTSPAITGGSGVPVSGATSSGLAEGGDAAAGVGQTFQLAGGAAVRVDSVIPNAPAPDGVFAPPEGVSITSLDVEACAGDTRYSFGPDAWAAYLDDVEVAQPVPGANDVVEIAPSPGGCVRFRLGFAVPEGRFLENLVFAVGGEEVERWELTFGAAPAEPLTADRDPEAAEVGETAELPGGGTVVLRTVDQNPTAIDAATTPPDGSQFVVVDGQVCAGDAPVRVLPFSWLAIATDNRVGTNVFSPSTFPSTELAAGQCGWGTVHLLLPADALPAYVVFTGAQGEEAARWRVGA